MLTRDIVIDESFAWDYNSSNSINKSLMSFDFDEETDEVVIEGIVENPVEVEEGVASTNQRPQRTRVRPIRLQDYEVTGDDEVIPDGELVHFSLLAGVEPINYSEALKIKQWKSPMFEELQAIERNNT